MSYGWLTESSCIPKPGKEIPHVSSQSLNSLKSLVFDEANKCKRNPNTPTWFQNREKKKLRKRLERLNDSKNQGVEARNAADQRYVLDTSNPYVVMEEKLKQKTRIYDALVSGKLKPESVSEELRGTRDGNHGFQKSDAALCLDIHAMSQNCSNESDTISTATPCSKSNMALVSQEKTDIPQPSVLRHQLRMRLKELSERQPTSNVSTGSSSIT